MAGVTKISADWLRQASLPDWIVRLTPQFYFCAMVLGTGLILGGATRGGFLSDSILQLMAVPLLIFGLWKLLDAPLPRQARLALLFCLGVATVPLVQLIPLPPWLWTLLPGRAETAALFEFMSKDTPWMPISVAPHQTWQSALAIIVPLSIFVGALLLTYRERRYLSLVILAVGTLSVLIGLLQVAQGPESPWRFYQVTNPTEAVGFFANRNHFAALVYTLILFAAAWATNAAMVAGRQSGSKPQYDSASIIAAIGCLCLLVALLAGAAMARSRAGLILTIAALFGAFAVGMADRRVSGGLTPRKLLASALVLALILGVQFALYRILERFEVDPLADARLSFIPTTIEAAKAYMPFGSGLGTFVQVYGAFEKPEAAIPNTYVNHAHNDAVELLLETGLFGMILLTVVLLWLAWRSLVVWRGAPPKETTEIDWSLIRAATIIIPLILAHSLVDYPLRTSAMMIILAFSCALLIEPVVGEELVTLPQSATQQRGRPTPATIPSPAFSQRATGTLAALSDGQTPSLGDRWGSDVQWPEEWRKPPD